MKRISVLLLALVMLTAGAVQAHAAKTLRMALGDPEDSEMGVVGNTFKKFVEDKSGGKIKVDLFFAKALGDETETIHNVRAGTLDLSCVGIANLVPFESRLGVLTLPYMFSNLDEVVAATTGAPSDLLNTYATAAGFRVLTWTYTDFRYISNSKRPITKMSDMKGLKFRVPQNRILIAANAAFGGSPVPISWAETFTALQQGVVDGQCYGYIGFKAMRFYEAHQKFISEVHYTYQVQPLIISERVFRNMSKDEQQMMIDAGKAAQEAVLEYQIREAGNAKKYLQSVGVQISQLEDEEEWKKVSMSKVWPEVAEFVGGAAVINAFLKAAGKQEWKP
jgi:tripartite ATP-independent transporter DctP family solute receptor